MFTEWSDKITLWGISQKVSHHMTEFLKTDSQVFIRWFNIWSDKTVLTETSLKLEKNEPLH